MIRGIAAAVFLCLAGAGAGAQSIDPEAATGRQEKQQVTAERFLAVTANPHASRAAFEMLDAGGSAVDAAIAAQLVLNLVEPQSSGLGGGAFALVRFGKAGKLQVYNGRETAPAASTPDQFLDPATGKPVSFFQAIEYGRAVAVPGLPRLLEALHRDGGKLPWAKLFEPAIRLADQGFAVSPRLAGLLAGGKRYFDNTPDMRRYFYHGDGTPLAIGETLRNPELAATLRLLAREGVDAFYRGPLATALLAKLQAAAAAAPVPVPVRMQAADLAGYRVRIEAPLCGPYRTWTLCGAGMPASGTATMLMTLGMLERFDLPHMGPADPRAWHLLAEASRRAFADREMWMADSSFVDVPVQGLLDRGYLAGRSATIDPQRVGEQVVTPGVPPGAKGTRAPDRKPERPGTSHLTIVDADGGIVSMTTSIETAFGSRLMVGGFLLNNHMTDFSFVPETGGRQVVNRIEPGKRPRSSMAPTLVLNGKGMPVLALGSPGGGAIPGYLLKTLVAALDWKLQPQAAIDLPHLFNRNGATELEPGPGTQAVKTALTAMGHQIRVSEQSSGIHAIGWYGGKLVGAADPRREGLALGR